MRRHPLRTRRPAGAGTRLAVAFDALEGLPALAQSRGRLLDAVRAERPSTEELVAAVESDVALSTRALRRANRGRPRRERVGSIAGAVAALSTQEIEAIAVSTPVLSWSQGAPVWERVPGRFRAHATAVYRTAAQLARETDCDDRDELLTAALLHDIGKLAMAHAHPGYGDRVDESSHTPEQRVEAERGAFGLDHATVGGMIARAWSLPHRLASTIEHHHGPDAGRHAALVRLADILAHYGEGHLVDIGETGRLGRLLGIGSESLGSLMYEASSPISSRERTVTPSPLSDRQQEVLRLLAEGKVYKQIADELGLSTHTVRNHAHHIFERLGVVDRAQAVLVAKEKGWL
jgi:putative nucleotidyltransferase with HDIG domain